MNYTAFMTRSSNTSWLSPEYALGDDWGFLRLGLNDAHRYRINTRNWLESDARFKQIDVEHESPEHKALVDAAIRTIDAQDGNTWAHIATVAGAAAREERIRRAALHGNAPKILYYFALPHDYATLDLVSISEPDTDHQAVLNLKQEVEDLKQQVAVLTGLVNLRTEHASPSLANAKARGASYMRSEFDSPENLSLSAASEYSGRSDRVINQERNRGALYALLLEGNTRGFRYPKWQFDVEASRLRAVLQVLIGTSMSCWALHSFLGRPHTDLDSRAPKDVIADNTFPLDRIVEVARRRVDQQQGAS
ncbi:hypothetical protein [Massilia haematophila]|uniref:Uncharacterized protein n=1 Tax=Massilia haematophila TaxID=457923 RepID=A0ABV7PU95_9BURK